MRSDRKPLPEQMCPPDSAIRLMARRGKTRIGTGTPFIHANYLRLILNGVLFINAMLEMPPFKFLAVCLPTSLRSNALKVAFFYKTGKCPPRAT
jgi:hypothetical protein